MTKNSPGEPGRARESPGEPWRARESPGEPGRARESPREPVCHLHAAHVWSMYGLHAALVWLACSLLSPRAASVQHFQENLVCSRHELV